MDDGCVRVSDRECLSEVGKGWEKVDEGRYCLLLKESGGALEMLCVANVAVGVVESVPMFAVGKV